MQYPAASRSGGVRRAPVVAALCAALALSLAGCSGGEEPEARPSPTPAPTSESVESPVAVTTTRSTYGKIVGRFPVARRKALRREITDVVEAWWDAAYLGGTFPRTDFPKAFPAFTKGAESRARVDKLLTTNRDISERIDSVTPKFRKVTIDVLATDKRARSVTARFNLRFATTGEFEKAVVVRGRLLLTHRKGTWRVFGYQVAKEKKEKGA